jgi:hypothetical protein
MIQHPRDRLEFCEKLEKEDVYFGKFHFTSGFRRTPHGLHALDWALINVDKKRASGNMVRITL